MGKLISILLLLALLCGCSAPITQRPTAPAPAVTEGDTLTVHFLDVGQADCALVECGGEYMLIDGGNVEDSDYVVSYLEELGVGELNTVVCSHAHEDHVGGLPAVLAVFPTEQIFSPTRTYASKCFDDFMYYADQQGLEVTLPTPGDSFSLGDATVLLLGPVTSYADPNNTSIVLKVILEDTAFLFTGDMEILAETDLLDSGADVSAQVLKVGHHGSSTSTGYRFLRAVDPAYAVISVGADNSYGHPHWETKKILNDADISILRTDELGAILAVSDGQNITFTWERQGATPGNTPEAESYYIGNKNSKKIHLPSCENLPAERNQVIFESMDEAIKQGYTPCGSCTPGD